VRKARPEKCCKRSEQGCLLPAISPSRNGPKNKTFSFFCRMAQRILGKESIHNNRPHKNGILWAAFAKRKNVRVFGTIGGSEKGTTTNLNFGRAISKSPLQFRNFVRAGSREKAERRERKEKKNERRKKERKKENHDRQIQWRRKS